MKDFEEWLRQSIPQNAPGNKLQWLKETLSIQTDADHEAFMHLVDDFACNYDDATCQCGNPGIMPPCTFCTHPGNFIVDGPVKDYLTELGFFE